MKIFPIHNKPALLIKNDKNTMVIADLHIGIEEEIRKAGFNIPIQTQKLIDKIIKLCKKHRIENLVIVGDVKHEVPGISWQERRELPQFFEKIEKIGEVYLTIGNHDTGIKKFITKNIKVFDSKGFVLDNIGFFHGHAWPKKEVIESDCVVMAHLHSTIIFKDDFGGKVIYPCWIKAKFSEEAKKYYDCKGELIIMPAFNQLCGGTYYKKKAVSPIISNKLINIDSAKIYLLNGTFLKNSNLSETIL